MAIRNMGNTVAFRQSEVALQYAAVYQSSGAYVSLCSSGATTGVGFQQKLSAAGDIVEVCFDVGANTLAIAGANNITVNQELMVTTSGVLIAATTGLYVVAIAKEASTAVGDLIEVQIANYQKIV